MNRVIEALNKGYCERTGWDGLILGGIWLVAMFFFILAVFTAWRFIERRFIEPRGQK